MTVFLIQTLYFSLIKVGSTSVGVSVLKKKGYWRSINPIQTSKVPLHVQKIYVWCSDPQPMCRGTLLCHIITGMPQILLESVLKY
jgi:hypothetical protein